MQEPQIDPVKSTSVSLDEAISAYSAGKISRHELEAETGLWFGEVLLELGKRGLPLPRYKPTYTPEQQALFDAVMGPTTLDQYPEFLARMEVDEAKRVVTLAVNFIDSQSIIDFAVQELPERGLSVVEMIDVETGKRNAQRGYEYKLQIEFGARIYPAYVIAFALPGTRACPSECVERALQYTLKIEV